MDGAPSIARQRAVLDRESQVWLAELAGRGRVREAALVRLRALLLNVARSEAHRRAHAVAGPELEDVAQQAASDALLAIVGKLDQFRGDSRFTTWAYKFAVLEVATKLTRHVWSSAPPTERGTEWDRLPQAFGFTPVEAVEWRELLVALRRAVDEQLTPRQRRIFEAIVLRGVPLDVLAEELGSNRNAIYKALFDARRKLRTALAADGHLLDEEH